jgi:NADH-quinone oxidoreductase subunit E
MSSHSLVADIPEPDFSDAELEAVRAIVARYPEPGARQAALIPVLWFAQKKWGWLSPSVQVLVADILALPLARVSSVVSFYTMFRQAPAGRYHLQVCRTLSCELAGSRKILDHLQERLGIRDGGTTPDGLFTLTSVECLASCGSGPMMQVGETFYERLDPERVDAILAALRAGQPPPNTEIDRWTYAIES